MKVQDDLELYRCGGLVFLVRPDTSDRKAIREVVERRGYASHGFTPAPGEHWLDLGANVGAFSVWAASKGATVTAWEPEPDCADLARSNVEINGMAESVAVHTAGVTHGLEQTTMELSVNSARGNVWRSSMFHQWRGGHTIPVRVDPIGPYWTANANIKMDIEGMEMPILETYADLPVRRLVFEWSFDIDRSLPRFRDVIARLEKAYDNVRGVPSSARQGGTWEPSWFPPCATIYCWSRP